MATSYTRRITLYINDREIENNIGSIQKAFFKATNELKRMEIGSAEYIAQIKKIQALRSVINEHNQTLRSTGSVLDNFQQRLQSMPGGLGQMASGLIDVGKAAAKFFLTPVGAIIGIIAAIGMGAKALIQNSLEFGKAASSLSAITGATGKDLDFLKQKAREISKESSQSATDMLGAFERIGSAMPELLKNGPLLAEVTKNAVALSESTGGKLSIEDAAKGAAAAMNQFNLPLTDSARAVNVMAAGALAGSAEVDQLTESLKSSGAVMAGANMTYEQGIAVLEVLSAKQLTGAEAGTAMRGVIMKLQAAGVGYASGQFNLRDALVEANGKIDSQKTALEKDAVAQKMFGQEGITAGKILLENVDKYDQLTIAVTGTNAAYDMAKVQQDNLSTSNKKFGEAWKNLMLSVEDGDGVFTKTWKSVVDFGTNSLNSVVEFFGTAKKEFIEFYNNSAPLRAGLEYISLIFKTVFLSISTQLKEVFNGVGGIGKVIKAVMTGNFGDIPGIIKDTFDKGKTIAAEGVEKMGNNIKSAWDKTINGKLELNVGGDPAKTQEQIAAEIKAAETLKEQKRIIAEQSAKDAKAAQEKAFDDLEIAQAKELNTIKQTQLDKKITEEQANEQLLKKELEYLVQKKELQKKFGVDTTDITAEILDKGLKAQADADKKAAEQKKKEQEKALKELENQEDAELNVIKQQLSDKLIDEDVAAQMLLAKEIEFLNRKIALKKQYGEDTADLEGQIIDKTQKIAENAAKGDKDRLKQLNDLRKEFADEEVVREQEKAAKLAELDALWKSGAITSEEEYQRLKTAISNKYEKNRYETVEKYLKMASGILDILSSVNNAAKDLELKKAGDNAAKKEAIEKKYAKRQQKISIAQAIVNGALGVTRVLADTVDPTGIYKAILVAGVIATTAAEVAAIASQKFQVGGFTSPSASDSTPVGVVHANEWVASAALLRDPVARRHIDYLENMQRGITPRFDTYAIAGAAHGFQSGGFSSPTATTSKRVTERVEVQSDPALLAAMQRMSDSADRLAAKELAINAVEVFNSKAQYDKAVNSGNM